MQTLEFHLLGRLEALSGDRHATDLEAAGKANELLVYLLLFRNRPHVREVLSDVLWGEGSSPMARKDLRQALWKLQSALKNYCAGRPPIVEIDTQWLRIPPDAGVRTDVDELERSFSRVEGKAGDSLSEAEAAGLRHAVSLYRGDLLEGWYQDWCVFERERIKAMYLALLDKLLVYCETHRQWEAGLTYGSIILRYDRAHERTHWRMMRLHYLSGDRTGAIRQYGTCVAALERALCIRPGERTTRLFEEICADRGTAATLGEGSSMSLSAVRRVVSHMRQVQQALAYTEDLVAQDIIDIEKRLERFASHHSSG